MLESTTSGSGRFDFLIVGVKDSCVFVEWIDASNDLSSLLLLLRILSVMLSKNISESFAGFVSFLALSLLLSLTMLCKFELERSLFIGDLLSLLLNVADMFLVLARQILTELWFIEFLSSALRP